MVQNIITFTANEQALKKTGGISNYASDTVGYVSAVFTLGDNWDGFDEIRAIFKCPVGEYPTVLDSQGQCNVPVEVLAQRGEVRVNLVGSIVTSEEVTDRLTTYSVRAFTVGEDVPVDGSDPQPITPTEYEQFVARVKADARSAEASARASREYAESAEQGASDAEDFARRAEDAQEEASTYAENAQNSALQAETARDDANTYAQQAEDAKDVILGMTAEATTLPSGSEATASYSGGVMSFGIPKGDKGDKGNTGDSAGFGTVSATVDDSTGTPSVEVTASGADTAKNFAFSFHNLKGAKGDKGDTGDVSMAQLEQVLPTDTASGSIASFPDGTSLFPAKAVKVSLEPIQSGSGTPSPDNIRPISGRTGCEVDVSGVNLFDVTQYPFIANTWINGNNGTKVPNALGWSATDDFVPCKHLAGQTVTLNHRPNGYTPGVAFYTEQSEASFVSGIRNNSGMEGTAWTFQIPSDAVYMRITVPPSYVDSIQLELGSTATDYEPYAGNTYNISWQTEAGTVYGCKVDAVSGVLTATMNLVNLGNTIVCTPSSQTTDVMVFAAAFSGNGWARHSATPNAISNRFSTSTPSGQAGRMVVTDQYLYFVIAKSELSSLDQSGARAWLNDHPTQLCYELAQPQTYTLTPTEIALFDGTNNVWSDGDVEVTYKADVQKWVEKKLG